MNILLLTSEFAPAMGGIGTYACEIASAATRLGARVTVVAPDYAQQTADDDEALPFKVVRFRGGLHSMRDMPAKIMLARRGVRGGDYDVVHAADWPFFIPVALSRWRTPARVLMTVHGTEINETQTPLKRAAIRGAGVFGPRTEIVANSRFTETLFRERFAVDASKISAINLGVSDFWFRRAKAARREIRLAYRLRRRQAGDGHRGTDDPPQGPSSDACRVGAAFPMICAIVSRGSWSARTAKPTMSTIFRRDAGQAADATSVSSARGRTRKSATSTRAVGFLLPDRPAGCDRPRRRVWTGLSRGRSRRPAQRCHRRSAVCLMPYSPTRPEFSFRHR